MSGKRYMAEFKAEALRQVTERGYSVREVAERLGVSAHSLYKCVGGVRQHRASCGDDELRTENARLKTELKRAQEERDILKRAAVGSIGQRNTLTFPP